MKVSSIILGALAAVVSATPIPGKEVSKRGNAFAFGAGNVFGSLAGGGFDQGLLNNFQFADPLLAHIALSSGFDNNILSGLAINNGLAFDGLAQTLLLQAQLGQVALSSLLDIHTLVTLSWLGNNGFLNNGINVGGLALPSALSFGLVDQFGLGGFNFNLAIDQALNQEILASLSNSVLFSGGVGFGGAAVLSSVQSTVIVKE